MLVGGLAATLAGCSIIPRRATPGTAPQVIELGAAETRTEPASPETPALAHFLAGTLAMNEGDQDEAAKQFEQAVAADPNSAVLHERLAAIYVRQGKLPDALEQCQAAVAIDPNDADSRLMLADVLSTVGRDDEAIREYETVLTLDPSH